MICCKRTLNFFSTLVKIWFAQGILRKRTNVLGPVDIKLCQTFKGEAPKKIVLGLCFQVWATWGSLWPWLGSRCWGWWWRGRAMPRTSRCGQFSSSTLCSQETESIVRILGDLSANSNISIHQTPLIESHHQCHRTYDFFIMVCSPACRWHRESWRQLVKAIRKLSTLSSDLSHPAWRG